MKIEKFEDIIAWQKAKELTLLFIVNLKTVEILALEIRFREPQFL